MYEKWGHKRKGIAEHLNANVRVTDIYICGNPQEGCWKYGMGENNPTCPTLSYSFLSGKQGEEGWKISQNLLASFTNTYSSNPKILP